MSYICEGSKCTICRLSVTSQLEYGVFCSGATGYLQARSNFTSFSSLPSYIGGEARSLEVVDSENFAYVLNSNCYYREVLYSTPGLTLIHLAHRSMAGTLGSGTRTNIEAQKSLPDVRPLRAAAYNRGGWHPPIHTRFYLAHSSKLRGTLR